MKLNIGCLIIFITALSLLAACDQESPRKAPVKAVKGILDLTEWDFARDGSVNLSGEYEFYWKEHLSPASSDDKSPPEKSGFIAVPGSWNGYEIAGKKISGTGYATYRLMILLGKNPPPLAFKFLDMGTAYAVFANGENILSVGQPGKSAESTVPYYLPQVVNFSPQTNQIEIIIHVSNFHHRLGGAWEIIQLGTIRQMSHARESRLFLDFLLIGGISIMGIYHLALFGFKEKDKSNLYFGIFCILIAARILTTVERYFIQVFPGITWENFVKIEYLSFYLSIPVFATFFHFLFTNEISKISLRIVQYVGISFACIVLITPVKIFSHTVQACELFAFICFIYGIYIVLLGVRRKREGAKTFLAGFMILFITVVNDILDVNEIIRTGHWVHFGVFIFILSQALILSYRFSNLKQSREQLRQLSVHIESAREEERKWIAREIHDDLGQNLTTLKMDLELLKNNLVDGKVGLPGKIAQMVNLVKSIIQKVRQLSQALRPSVLDNLGFSEAVTWQAREFEKRSNIECKLSIQPQEIHLNDTISSALFRVFQEVLTNVSRHSNATIVTVDLKKKHDELWFKIRDNGVGITKEQIVNPNAFGLTSIRERINFLNGTIEISGKHKIGTSITIYVPLKKVKEAHS